MTFNDIQRRKRPQTANTTSSVDNTSPDSDSKNNAINRQSTTRSRLFIFVICVIFRFMNAWLTRTYDNPDEYWQVQEVAHHMVFGYGYLTWEWKEKIRSFAHPLLFASIYKLLQWVHLDQSYLLVIAPKYVQALFAAVADYATYSFVKKVVAPSMAPFILFITLTSWYNFFMAGRTLSNSMEMVFTSLALRYWPIHIPSRVMATEQKSDFRKALAWAALACLMRPTGAILWIFLGAELLFCTLPRWRLWVLFNAMTIVATTLLMSCILDTRFYTGNWSRVLDNPILAPIQFVRVNVFQAISLFYGVHPWHWYVSQGVPVVTTTLLPWIIFGVVQLRKNKDAWIRVRPFVYCSIWVLGVYSLLSHKEFRFIYPIFPIALLLASVGIARCPLRWRRWAVFSIVATQLPMALYLSLVHQRGVMEVMLWARTLPSPSMGFLMPCHSTPWQSIMHNPDADIWFLTCEPNLDKKPDYMDEADLFYRDPASFLEHRFKHERWPDHVVLFENLLTRPQSGLVPIRTILDRVGYSICQRFFNSHFHDDWRRRGDVLVLCRQQNRSGPQ